MLLVFQRTGDRRYGIQVRRPPFPDVEMTTAPGYDSLMPHDMLHLVVEAKLGLSHGIFGQLAAGGNAGTFHPTVNQQKSRKSSRIRHRLKTRGEKLLREGRDESLQSERATYICGYEWRNRSKVSKQGSEAQSMTRQVKQIRDVAGARELEKLNNRKIDEICAHLDELSARWSQLKIGQSMTVRWPDLKVLEDDKDERVDNGRTT